MPMRRMTTLSSMIFPRSGLSRLSVISARWARCCFIFTTIDVPGAILTNAFGINSPGNIVGLYIDTTAREHGFLLAAGSFSTIDVPGAVRTEARGINNSGHIVGGYIDTAGRDHGFDLAAGIFSTIDFPGAIATEAFGINDPRHIVGFYLDATGMTHGFSATPCHKNDDDDDCGNDRPGGLAP